MRNELNQIQWLRGIAALLVIVTHFTGKAFSVHLIDYSFSKGAIGVDIFFIISGFIMMYVSDARKQETIPFIKNRAIRILPLHIFFFLLLFVVYSIKPEIINSNVDKTYVWESLFLIPMSRDNAEYLNPVTWTLCYEIMFYLIFSISLFLKNLVSSFYLTSGVIILISSFGIFYTGGNAFITGVTDSISIEFLMGMGIFILYKKKFLKFNPVIILLLSFSLYFFLNYLDLPRFVKDGFPSALLFIAFINLPNIKMPVLNYLGDISYEIYLCHIICISLAYVVLKKIGFINVPSFIVLTAFLILSVSSITALMQKKINQIKKNIKNKKHYAVE